MKFDKKTKWTELLFIRKEVLLILEVVIEKENNYYTLTNKKMKLVINSKSDNLEDAKKEFSDFVFALIKHWIKKDRFELMLDLCGFKKDKTINHLKNFSEIEYEKKIIKAQEDFVESNLNLVWNNEIINYRQI